MLQRTLVGGIALLIAVPGQAASDPLAAVLEAKTQALLDAIAPGEKGLWNAALAPNLVYVTENNEVLTKDELIKQIASLNATISAAGAANSLTAQDQQAVALESLSQLAH